MRDKDAREMIAELAEDVNSVRCINTGLIKQCNLADARYATLKSIVKKLAKQISGVKKSNLQKRITGANFQIGLLFHHLGLEIETILPEPKKVIIRKVVNDER